MASDRGACGEAFVKRSAVSAGVSVQRSQVFGFTGWPLRRSSKYSAGRPWPPELPTVATASPRLHRVAGILAAARRCARTGSCSRCRGRRSAAGRSRSSSRRTPRVPSATALTGVPALARDQQALAAAAVGHACRRNRPAGCPTAASPGRRPAAAARDATAGVRGARAGCPGAALRVARARLRGGGLAAAASARAAAAAACFSTRSRPLASRPRRLLALARSW